MTHQLDSLAAPEMRAVTYLRVSSKRQMDTAADIDPDGNSIATQREACRRKADHLGATIVEEFVEPGTSAQTIEKRSIFRQMLGYLNEHPDIDYVVIYMRSRAFRNLGDAVLTKRRLEQMRIKLVSAKEDFGEGIMADAMEAVTDIMNEVQVRMSGEDIKIKMRHKAENGGTLTRAKLGYKNIRVEHEGRLVNTIGLDQERAPLVRTMFELYATGEYSIERLSDAVADLGLTTRPTRRNASQPVATSHIHRMLSDPYYTSVVVYQGEMYPGRHEAIVGRDLFDRVQEVLATRSTRGQRDRKHFHYLKGLLYCERCRAAGRTSRLVYGESTGASGRKYPYYVCMGRQRGGVCDLPNLPVHLVERAVARYYPTLAFGEDFSQAAVRAIHGVMTDEKRTVQDLHDGFRKRLKELEVQEERLLDLATDGDLPKAKIKQRLRRIQIDRERAQEGLRETGEQLAVGAQVLLTYAQLLEEPAALYEIAPPAVRRQLNEAFFQRLFVDDYGIAEDWQTDALRDIRGITVHEQSPSGSTAGALKLGGSDPTGLATSSSKTNLVGLTGFEPAASSSRTRRATKLRHSPIAFRSSATNAPGDRQASPYRSRPVRRESVPVTGDQVHQGGLRAAGDADLGVRRGAQAGRDVQPCRARVARLGAGRVPVQALGPGGLEVAVGGECPASRQAHLAAVGVTGDHHVPAVAGEPVQHPEVRRVGHRQPQVGVRRDGGGDGVEVVEAQVRVVHAGERDVGALDRQPPRGVGEVQPAGPAELAAQQPPRHLRRADMALAAVRQQVRQGVAQGRLEVVVGAQDERPGHVEQVAERVEQHGHRVAVREVVAGVDHEVGPETRELAHPALLHALTGGEVQVAEVQHAQGRVSRRQDRHGHLPQHEGPRLRHGVRREGSARRGSEAEGAADNAGEAHAARLPQWRA